MFKKLFLSCLLIGTLFSVGNNNASAAIIDSEPAQIFFGDTTATTSRVTLTSGKKLVIESLTTGSGAIQFRIFKNGVSFLDYPPSSTSFSSRVVPNTTAGEYSLRAYCGDANNAKTNCAAHFKIYVQD